MLLLQKKQCFGLGAMPSYAWGFWLALCSITSIGAPLVMEIHLRTLKQKSVAEEQGSFYFYWLIVDLG